MTKILQWLNGKIKSLINEKLKAYNAYRKNISNSQLRKNVSSLQQWLRDLIDSSKQKYFLRLRQKHPPRLHFLTDKRLSMVKFANNDILKIIQNLNRNKSCDHDKISIRMVKIGGDSLCRPLGLIFNFYWQIDYFHLTGRKIIQYLYTRKMISNV